MVYNFITERRGEVTCRTSYGRIVWVIVQEIKNNYGTLTEKDKRSLKNSMNAVLRNFTDDKPEFVSRKVADMIFEINPKIDPFDISPQQQKRIFGIGGNKLVVFEHVVPILTLYNDLFRCENIDQVCETLSNYPGTAIVTTVEDTCLTKSGYRTKRSNDDWKEAYQSCGIDILSPEDYSNYIQEKINRYKRSSEMNLDD